MNMPLQPGDARVYVGALAPEALKITITPNASMPDLSIVTGADVLPIYNGVPLPLWLIDQTLVQTATQIQYVHLWQPSDTTMARLGLHTLVVRLYVGPQTRRCIPKRFFVRPLEA